MMKTTTTAIETKMPLTYYQNQCYFNAYINKKHHYKGKNLKLVIGSLGFYDWFEFGGKEWGMLEFALRLNTDSSDSHCWLEDEQGNIYDYIFKDYNRISKKRTGKVLPYLGILEGKSKEWCQSKGLTYLPASKEVQRMLFLQCFHLLNRAEKDLQTGRARWVIDKYQQEKAVLETITYDSFLSFCEAEMKKAHNEKKN